MAPSEIGKPAVSYMISGGFQRELPDGSCDASYLASLGDNDSDIAQFNALSSAVLVTRAFAEHAAEFAAGAGKRIYIALPGIRYKASPVPRTSAVSSVHIYPESGFDKDVEYLITPLSLRSRNGIPMA